MTPVQLLARLAALIPPSRLPLPRLSGVSAPRSRLRAAVIPRGPAARAGAMATLPRAMTRRTPTPNAASPRGASAEGTPPDGEPRERELRGERLAHEPRRWRRESSLREDRVGAAAPSNLAWQTFWSAVVVVVALLAPRAADRGAADGAGAECRFRAGVNGSGLGQRLKPRYGRSPPSRRAARRPLHRPGLLLGPRRRSSYGVNTPETVDAEPPDGCDWNGVVIDPPVCAATSTKYDEPLVSMPAGIVTLVP